MLTALMAGCSSGSGSSSTDPSTDPSTASIVLETSPIDTVTDVSLNSPVVVTFSEAMDDTTINTDSFTVIGKNETPLVGIITYNKKAKTASFKADRNFTASTLYTATLTTAVKTTAGNSMATDYVWSFTSGSTEDTTAPTVSSTDPADIAGDVALNRNVTATFSEALDPTIVSTAPSVFTLSDGTTSVPGEVSYINKVLTFDPTDNLASNTPYTATLTTGITDLTDNALAADYVWNFTTGNTVAQGPDRVKLGTAGDFVILAKSAISKDSAAGTLVTGDIGLSPAALSFITGFSETMDASNEFATSTYVVGSIYASNMAPPTPAKMTTAVSDMETAYTDAAGRPTPDKLNLGSGEIGGKILVPGLYKWGTGVTISTNVTIKGGANDVWIFQVEGDITQAGTADVILDGALAKNIFWQVAGSTVLIGTGATFNGVVLAKKQINVKTGATVNGRLLAQTQVTLEGNAVTQP